MLEIDKPLLDMITGALDEIHQWVEACGGARFTLDDVDWDERTAIPESPLVDPVILLKASHSIGFICGVAAGLDVTPLSLLWAIGVDTESPICAARAPVVERCPYCRGSGTIRNTVDFGLPPEVDCSCPAGMARSAKPAPDRRRAKRQHSPTVNAKTRKAKP
jgi:hypothetical protein